MKLKRKKGFTIVELVIVVAVIAILAAVLIPTFSNLIKKANLSSDQVAVRNMNNALAMDETVNGKPVDLLDAMKRMQENGYDFDSYKPLTEGYRFFWNSEANKVVLAQAQVNDEGSTDYVITYPADLADTEFDTALYKALYRDTVASRTAVEKLRTEITAASGTAEKTVEVEDANELAALAAIVNGDYDDPNDLSGYTIKVGKKIELGNQIWIPIGEAENAPFRGKLIGDAEGSVINELSSEGYNASIANASKLTSGQIGVSYGLIGFAENATIENITLTNVNIDLSTSGQEMGAIVGYARGAFTMKGCTVGAAGDGSRVIGQTKVGGLVGMIDTWAYGEDRAFLGDVIIEHCTNYAEVNATTADTNGRVGGIVGAFCISTNEQNNNIFKNCVNYGKVQSSMFAGGILGQRYQGGEKATVTFEACEDKGQVVSLRTASNADMDIPAEQYCGALIAYWQQGGTLVIKNCTEISELTVGIMGVVHSTSSKYFLQITSNEGIKSYGLHTGTVNAPDISSSAYKADYSKVTAEAISKDDLSQSANRGYWLPISD